MTHSILARLQQDKGSNSEVADLVYNAMLSDMETKALEKARSKVQIEISSAKFDISDAQSETTKAQAETIEARAGVTKIEADRDSLKVMLETSEKIVTTLRGEVTQLVAALKIEQQSLSEKDKRITQNSEGLKTDLADERIKSKNLKLELSNLQGKLSTKPGKTKQVQSHIPSFTIDNVTRGTNDRIISATITPVRLN